MEQGFRYLKVKLVLGLITLVVGLLAANLALFHWVERTGLYYLLGNFARYVCAYGGFAAMIFGAMLINDFWVMHACRNVLKGESVEHTLQYAACIARERRIKMKAVKGRMYFMGRRDGAAKCPHCGMEVATPRKSWKMAGRPDKKGKRTELTIGLFDHCGKTFRAVLAKRKI